MGGEAHAFGKRHEEIDDGGETFWGADAVRKGVRGVSQNQAGRGDLAALLRMLRRRLPLIVLAPIIALGAAYAIAKSQHKAYTGTSVLLFKPLLLDVQLTGVPLQLQSSDPATE